MALDSSQAPLILPVSEFTHVTHTTINESIILKCGSFVGRTHSVHLRMTKMWGFHSNGKKAKKMLFAQSDVTHTRIITITAPPIG